MTDLRLRYLTSLFRFGHRGIVLGLVLPGMQNPLDPGVLVGVERRDDLIHSIVDLAKKVWRRSSGQTG